MANADRMNGSGILRREWRQLGRLVLESFAAGIVVSLALALAVFIVTTPAYAAGGDAGQGTLYLKEADGSQVASPLLFTDVHMDVSGMIARVQVEQRFVNPTAEWREGVYVFPLPEKAAVDHLRMQIGERVIEGQIKERGEARRTYETAKGEGRKTTLVEQERPNMFTTSVANIGPFEEIVVAIEYQETLRYDEGIVSRALSAGDHAALHPGRRRLRRTAAASAGRPRRSRCSMPIASRRRSPTAQRGLRESGGDHHRSQRRLRALRTCPAPTTRCASRSNPDTASG